MNTPKTLGYRINDHEVVYVKHSDPMDFFIIHDGYFQKSKWQKLKEFIFGNLKSEFEYLWNRRKIHEQLRKNRIRNINVPT